MEMTKGRGPDRCIDAVGCEAHASGTLDAVYDKGKGGHASGTDRAHVLREAIIAAARAARSRSRASTSASRTRSRSGAAMNKGLTVQTGQTHVPRYTDMLLRKIEDGEIDPSFVITHRLKLGEAPGATRRSATRRTAASRSC